VRSRRALKENGRLRRKRTQNQKPRCALARSLALQNKATTKYRSSFLLSLCLFPVILSSTQTVVFVSYFRNYVASRAAPSRVSAALLYCSIYPPFGSKTTVHSIGMQLGLVYGVCFGRDGTSSLETGANSRFCGGRSPRHLISHPHSHK
jgi:hypothetical protein